MTSVDLSKASNWLQVMNKLHSLSVLLLCSCELPAIGPLPHVNFSSLLILDLSFNDLSSSSFDWFADLSSLTALNLEYSQIHGLIPSSLRNLTSLGFLDICGNNFAPPIPNWLYHITALEYLDLGSLGFESHNFHGIGNLTSLIHLDLSYNALDQVEIFRALGNLCSFQLSKFSYYRLGKSLMFFSVRGNQLSGSIPDSILEECRSLVHLDFSENRLSGQIPLSLGGISSLHYLNIGNNFFKGIMSEKHFANLTSLEELYATPNLFAWQVSSNWTPPFQLRKLCLADCFIGPQFPAWLQTQKYLEELRLQNTGISSAIPAWFWTTSCDVVDLSQNQIIGVIPRIHYSSRVYLGSNNFTGPLPQISSDVTELILSNNLFSGSLSPMLCQRRTDKEVNLLEDLDISGNLLSGELPNCWMYWTGLTTLDLRNNNLTGHIPNSMGSLFWLGLLHLRNNHLFGDVPVSLKNCSSLMVLDLGENEFTGSIPAWMGNFSGKFIKMFSVHEQIVYTPGLMVLLLHSNKFNGSIPLELCHLDTLQILDLGNNNLSGSIPRCFGNFSRMVKQSNSTSPFLFHNDHSFSLGSIDTATLAMKGAEYVESLGLLAGIDLSSNKLSSAIPEEITGLHGLIFLNLSHNHLQGKIPVKIGDMKSPRVS